MGEVAYRRARMLYVFPASMNAIVEAVGTSAATSLCHIYGGTDLRVPKRANMHEQHPIASLIGLPLALRLADAFGGEYVPIANGNRVLANAREAWIIAAWNNGLSSIEIGRRFLISDRTVRLTIARARAAGMPIADHAHGLAVAKAKKA